MAITKRVQQELVQAAPTAAASLDAKARPRVSALRRRRRTDRSTPSEPLVLSKAQREAAAAKSKGKAWTADEHQRFLEALELFPAGPWKAIASHVGTKNSRQTMTHAQKCREKHERKTRAQRHRATSKKTKRASIRKQPSIRRRVPASASTTSRQLQEPENTEEDRSDVTDQGEDMECLDETHQQPHADTSHTRQHTADSLDVKLDETTFFNGCEDALIAASAGSAPSMMSLLSSLPEHMLLSSDDLWHSQSLAEVALGGASGRLGDGIDDDNLDATDFEDLQEFAVGLSQECW